MASAALLIAGVTAAARGFGFARFVVFAHTVGPTCLGDTYSTANTVPNIVFDVVAGGALSSLVVPVLAGAVSAGDTERVGRTASALLTWAAIVLVPVTVAGALLSHPLIRVLVGTPHSGCSSAREIEVGARMLVVFMPQVLLYGVGVILTGVLQAHRRFLGPALGPLLSSLVVIAVYAGFSVVSGSRQGLAQVSLGHQLLLSVGTTLGVAALVGPLLLPTRRTGIRLRPTTHFPPGVAATVRRMAVSGAVVLASQDVATAVVLRLSNSHGAHGSVVLYNLAWAVFVLPWAVVAVPLATSAFPGMTTQWQSGDRTAYAATTARALRVLVPATAGAAAVVGVTAGPLARLIVLGPGAHGAAVALARALVGFAPGLLGYALVALLSRALYAQGDARTPATATACGWLVAIVADVVLVEAVPRGWTVAAIGAGTSVGMSVAGGWLLLALRRSAGASAVTGALRGTGGALAGVAVAGALGGALSQLWTSTGLVGSAVEAVVLGCLAFALYAGTVSLVDPAATRLLVARLRSVRASLPDRPG